MILDWKKDETIDGRYTAALPSGGYFEISMLQRNRSPYGFLHLVFSDGDDMAIDQGYDDPYDAMGTAQAIVDAITVVKEGA